MSRELFSPLTEENLQRIKTIEAAAYANTCYSQMQWVETWEDMADYMECDVEDIRMYCNDHFYLLVAEQEDYAEVVDLARSNGAADLVRVVRILESLDKPLEMDCRESTSYPILKFMEKTGRCQILKDEPYSWEDEIFHEVRAVTTKALERNPSLAEDLKMEDREYE